MLTEILKGLYAKLHRNAVRAAVVLTALGGVSLAHAQTYPVGQNLSNLNDLGRFYYTTNAARITAQYSATPAWTVASGGGSLAMRGAGVVGAAGAVDVATTVPFRAIAAGASRLMGGPVGIALLVGAPLLKDWLATNNIFANSDNTGLTINEYKTGTCGPTDCLLFYESDSVNGPFYTEPLTIAEKWENAKAAQYGWFKRQGGCTLFNGSPTVVSCPYVNTAADDYLAGDHSVRYDVFPVPYKQGQASLDLTSRSLPLSELPDHLVKAPSPNIIPEIVGKGGEITGSDAAPQQYDQTGMLPSVQISGPGSISEGSKTTQNPDGTTTEVKTTRNNTYDGNKVTTNTTNITITRNGDTITNTTTTTTNNTSNSSTQETSDMCKTNPDALACQKIDLDTPAGEIPKSSKQITYTEENPFGAGSCPADLTATLGTLHQSVKVWDWQKTCEYALPLRALVVGLAGFAAFLIVMPGSPRV